MNSYYSTPFSFIKIKLASPTRILEWAQRFFPNGQVIGEIQKSETVNYRTFRPEMDGLFCERVFGPSKDLECACGKYKRIRYTGYICELCGVEITESRVRRHRMGYIDLIYPVAHVWYINSRPNFLALLLEVEACEKTFNTTYTTLTETWDKEKKIFVSISKPTSAKTIQRWDDRIKRIKLASIAYFLGEDDTAFYGLHWDFLYYRAARLLGATSYPLKPEPKTTGLYDPVPAYLIKAVPSYLLGTPAIKSGLEKLNVKVEIYRTRIFILDCNQTLQKKSIHYSMSHWFRKWEQKRLYKLQNQAFKRLRILENFSATNAEPVWMILEYLPIIPPALRPILQLEGGQFASSDLNELYRRIINRNNRLSRLITIDAPQLIIRNEKRMLQEAVDALIDNGRRGKIAVDMKNKPLRSLSDIIKGKQGRFRQNLLGKRVDYSGRSVIIVGPTLKLNQCGLPYKMVLELFQPFIIRELIIQGYVTTIKSALKLMKEDNETIIPVLHKVLNNHPVFLNRAPTLHRLGIQAFEPILMYGKAIRLHPLVCSAFNADFDGDQMAVHIPLSVEAQAECSMLLLAPYNFLSPATGTPMIVPSQDMVLGCYYLTLTNVPNLLGSIHYFSNMEDAILAYEQDQIELHSSIWVRYEHQLENVGPLMKKQILFDGTFIEFYENLQIRKTKKGKKLVQYLKTTVGRIIFNSTIQKILN